MHDFSGIDGSLARSIKQRDLQAIRSDARRMARDLGRPPKLDQALDILDVIRDQEPDTFNRAAALWLSRLILERQVGLLDVEAAAQAMDVLLGLDRETLDELVDRPPSAAEAAKPIPGVDAPSST